MTIIDSLVAKLSFDFDDKALKEFDKGMKQATKAVAAIAAGASVAGAAILAFTSKIAEQNDELGKTAQIIGITSQSLNELGFVAQLNGGSVNSMSSSLENLAKTASEAARGVGAGVEAFGLLGISTTDVNGQIKQTDDLLLNVADAVSQLNSQSEKIELINKLGIDSSLLLTLEQGSEAIRKQRKEVEALGFVLDKDATESAANFKEGMFRIMTVVKGISSAIGTKLMKQITPMIKAFLEWFKVNKEIIKLRIDDFFQKLVKILRGLFNISIRISKLIKAIVNAFGGWKNVAFGLAVSILILSEALQSLLLNLGKIGIILLILEDFIAFMSGAESQMGELAKKSNTFKIILESIVEVLHDVANGWNLLFNNGAEALEGLIILIKDVGSTLFNWLITPLNNAIKLLNKLPGVNVTQIQQTQTSGALNTFTGGLAGSTTNHSTNNKEVVININGGNVEEVKQAVSEALGAEFKSTELNMSTPTRF